MTQEQSSKYTFRLTPKRLLGWGALMLFLLGWMFVLGLLVGRGTVTVPRKSQALTSELAELKEKALAKEREEIEAQAKESQDKTTELGFYKALKEPPPKPPALIRPSPTPLKPQATPVKPKATPAAQAVAAPGEVATPKPATSPKSTVTPKPAEKPEAPATPTPEVKPAAAEPAPGKAHFTVQVAAFRDLESANKLVAALRGKGYSAYPLRTETVAKVAWFRVRVGAFESLPAADAILKKLQGEKFKAVV
ncbi:MAG: SPOR domain-containing protein, partial [Desulfobacterales bacterium]|nr:SPOR domain-containing protein [Desulfobacterales bacterium]